MTGITWLHARSVCRSRFPMVRLSTSLLLSLAILVLFDCGLCAQINLAPPNQLHSVQNNPAPFTPSPYPQAQSNSSPLQGNALPVNNLHPAGPQDGYQQSQLPLAGPQFRTASQPNFRSQQLPNAQPLGPPLPGAQQPSVQPQGAQALGGPVNVANPGLQNLAQPVGTGAPQAPISTPQSSTPVSDAVSITPEAVSNRLQQVQTATDLEPTLKQTLTATYEAINAELKSRAESEKVIREYIAAYEAAPAATVEAKKRKEKPRPRIVFYEGTLESTSRIETLQSYQLEVQSLAQAATDGRVRVETAIMSREARRKELPGLLTDDKNSIKKLNEELALPAVDGIDPRIREADTLSRRAKLLALNERIRRLEQEQRTYDAEQELLPITKEVLMAEEKFQRGKLKEVTDELSKRREILISNQKNVAEGLVQQSAPENKKLAEQLVKRSDDWLRLAQQNSSLRMEVDAAAAELKLWTDRFNIMSERISPKSSKHVSNFNSWVGLMLRKQRNELPDINQLALKQRDYQTRILSTQTLILELDDWKASSAPNLDSTPPMITAGALDQFASAPTRDQQRTLQALELRLVDDFRRDADGYVDSLMALGLTNQKTIDQVRLYRSFIDEHVLWIRSSEPINKSDFQQLWPSIRWFFDLQNWRGIPLQLWKDFLTHPWGYMFGLSCYVTLLFSLKRFKKHIQTQGAIATKSNCTSFVPTAKVVLDCALLSSPLALLHLVLGWRLMSTSEGNAFVDAIAMGLMVSARYFFPLEMIRQISRAGGLAESHFQWSTRTNQLLRKNLRWFIDLAIPAVTVVGVVAQFGEARWENSLGRLTYSLLMSLCFIYLLILLHPRRGVFSDFMSRNAGGWIDRLKYIWYTGFAFGPLALMAMSLMGYHYTAIRLTMLLHTTFITLVGLMLLSSMIRRWLLLRRREIVVSQARQRLEEARRRDPGGAANTAIHTGAIASAVDSRSDLAQINAQTIRLVGSTLIFAAIGAVAFIWSGVLPAVGVLESVHLWSVEGATPDKTIPITLADLFVAIPIAIMTAVAARNLPGLLEIALLQHLPLENAVRYAIASLSRYTLLILGIALTFNSIGVRWSSIQWLVAALGVGLGFGLQEIFANFVSGLILLFEQPIRVGDVITLGDTTGSVSRIRMRATTVTNFDQQELIIPNKDLITGRLLNWTLSDSTNRIVISVGVSYNSDPELACALLREVCVNHPNVLAEPPPTAYFEQFGDSTLDLKVRLYLANLDQRLPTRHDLHAQILKRFAAAGIEISFPQRDLHLRSVPKEFASILRGEMSVPVAGKPGAETSALAREAPSPAPVAGTNNKFQGD